jgi:hypothetical protein
MYGILPALFQHPVTISEKSSPDPRNNSADRFVRGRNGAAKVAIVDTIAPIPERVSDWDVRLTYVFAGSGAGEYCDPRTSLQ